MDRAAAGTAESVTVVGHKVRHIRSSVDSN